MKRLIFSLIFSFLYSIGCKIDKTNKVFDQSYIISKEDFLSKQKWKNKNIPPPPPLFYGDYNFVVDTIGSIYLYRTNYRLLWNDYKDENDTNPPLVGLHASDFILMNQQSVKDFISYADTNWNPLSTMIISSSSDTISSKNIYPIINFLSTKRIIKYWRIRRITQEEDSILNLKNSIRR